MILAFFSHAIINIGGEVSPSFLFILATMPFWVRKISFKDKNVATFTKLFSVLLLVQIVWIPFAKTEFILQLKAVLITVSGLIYFWFYYFVYSHNKSVIKWGLLASFISTFFFTNVLAEMLGGEYGFWKFQIYPRITTVVVLFYIWFIDNHKVMKYSPILFMLVSLLGFATGCRSNALYHFIPGAICFFIYRFNKKLNLKRIKGALLCGCVFLYLMYAAFYVPNILNGNITEGNSEQLLRSENPYNPLNLLMIGRADAITPFIAFLDKPITGWGWATPDPNYKYHWLNAQFQSVDIKDDLFFTNDVIPGHSIWGAFSCGYGMVAFIVFFLLIKYLTTKFFHSLVYKDKYLLYRAYIYVVIMWTVLFAPPGFLKTLPASIALLLVLADTAKYELYNINLSRSKSEKYV